jgi:hypothetical protein
MQEVVGSIPSGSTILLLFLARSVSALCAPHRPGSGLFPQLKDWRVNRAIRWRAVTYL